MKSNSKAMKNTAKFPAPRNASNNSLDLDMGQVTWEYRFCEAQEMEAPGSVTAEGWMFVSSRLRTDNRREYLLKRPRR
jgi:hypothetical protein